MYTLAVFKNDAENIFHIWPTEQEKWRQNVSIANLYSKAKNALSGKDNAQGSASSTLFRVASCTNRKDWDVDYVELGDVSKDESKAQAEIYAKLLEDEGYTCISRHPRWRAQSSEYAGGKWRVTKIQNLRYAQVKNHAVNMLQDCFYKGEVDRTANCISNFALKVDSEILNISQMWQHVYNEYALKG